MVDLSIAHGSLVLHVRGMDRLWAFTSTLEIPLRHIAAVRADPLVAHGWWHGIRLLGTHVPGVITAGTFHQDGKRIFWDVHDPAKTIVLELHDDVYHELIVEVDDPAAAVARVSAALAPIPQPLELRTMAAISRAALLVAAVTACARPARTTPAAAATPVPAAAPAAGLKEWTLMKNGGSMMRLVGDPYKAEWFAFRVRYPADMKTDSAPHYHMGTEHVTILTGTLVLGFGDHVDVTKVTEYGPGSFIVIPAGVHHYEWFKGETMSHVEGFGPMGTIRLDRPDSTHAPAVPASH